MLEHLEFADGHAELLALFQVFQSQVTGHFHGAYRLTAQCGDGASGLVFNDFCSLAFLAEQGVGA